MFLRMTMIRAGVVAGAMGAMALPIVALAAHGKAGLWEVTTRMNMPGMMAAIPPDQMARMRAMGIQMPNGQTFTAQHCMTAADVAADKPPPMRNTRECTATNISQDAHTMNVTMTCSGDMDGQGHLSVTYDSDEHYSGSYTFTGTAHGHPASVSNSFEGRWLSADCGTVK